MKMQKKKSELSEVRKKNAGQYFFKQMENVKEYID